MGNLPSYVVAGQVDPRQFCQGRETTFGQSAAEVVATKVYLRHVPVVAADASSVPRAGAIGRSEVASARVATEGFVGILATTSVPLLAVRCIEKILKSFALAQREVGAVRSPTAWRTRGGRDAV